MIVYGWRTLPRRAEAICIGEEPLKHPPNTWRSFDHVKHLFVFPWSTHGSSKDLRVLQRTLNDLYISECTSVARVCSYSIWPVHCEGFQLSKVHSLSSRGAGSCQWTRLGLGRLHVTITPVNDQRSHYTIRWLLATSWRHPPIHRLYHRTWGRGLGIFGALLSFIEICRVYNYAL